MKGETDCGGRSNLIQIEHLALSQSGLQLTVGHQYELGK
jgi:hypothetical protein